ncbi:MAG: FtsX-like permease family protein [Burkholderiaceae bacterium]
MDLALRDGFLMLIIRLAIASLFNRRTTALLTILSIAVSVVMLLGVEKIRRDAKLGFANSVSGTDLIVGARSGAVQLLLYSVFRMGDATANVSWATYQAIANEPEVAWAVPISLGDSHSGFRVLGTTTAYFDHFRFGNRQSLEFAQGRVFNRPFDVVLGAEVAHKLGYMTGESIVLSHGTGELELSRHADKPFTVVGLLAPTGTPVDRTVHVSLAGIEAIHDDWEDGRHQPSGVIGKRPVNPEELVPESITAFLVGVKKKSQIFSLQRKINTMSLEPLMAIIPGVALQQLWDLMRVAEQTLRIISVFVVFTALLGMLTVILAALEARRRELAVLRAVGARPRHLAALLVVEAGLFSLVGTALGLLILAGLTTLARPFVLREFGVPLLPSWPYSGDLALLAALIASALLVSLIPAWRAFRMSLSDGLSIRV